MSPRHYLRRAQSGQLCEAWEIHDTFARPVGETRLEGIRIFHAEPGEHVFDALERQTSWKPHETFVPLLLPVGHFYPRIARPLSGVSHAMRSPSTHFEPNVIAAFRSQLLTLTRKLHEICLTIQPEQANLGAYGHEIRNLLILACTEVEACWRGILVANGFSKDRATTNDYVRLASVMRLADYAVSFPAFPWLAAARPFADWDARDPTATLPWYAAYHGVKHNREGEFYRASLENAFAAMSACAIMLAAQFTGNWMFGSRTELAAFFRLDQIPEWDIEQSYVDDGRPALDWEPVPHPDLR